MATATAIISFSPEPLARARRELVEEFCAGRNVNTMAAYRDDLADFARFLGAENVEAAARRLLARGAGEANGLVLGYRAHLVERGLQATTINRRLAAIRSLVKFANVLGLVPWALQVANLKEQAWRDTRGPGRQGFRMMLEAAGNDRDRAILRLLHDIGLRRAEVLALDLADVELEEGCVWIIGKGRTAKERLTVPEQTKAALAAWIDKRGAEPGPLFTNFDRGHKTRHTRRLSGAGLWYMVRALGRKVGIVTRPHGLRHSGITEALDLTNGNVRAVQKFSRHRDLRILTIYDDNRLDLAGDVARLVASDL